MKDDIKNKISDLPPEEEMINAKIAEINVNHALVLSGNKASVMKFDSVTKFRLLQVAAFKQWYSNQLVTIGKKIMSVADYWLSHPKRRQYEGIEFEPGGGRPNHYNLWQGFAVKPKKGDCSKFLAHLKDNISRGDEHRLQALDVVGQVVGRIHVWTLPCAGCRRSAMHRSRTPGRGSTR